MKMLLINLLIVVSLISCSESTTHYIQPDLNKYLEYFDSLAILHGKRFDYSNLILKTTPNLSANKKSIGLTTLVRHGQRTIQFDFDWWASANESKRQVLFLHEFGHGFLHKQHTNTYSIMNTDLADKGWPVCSINTDGSENNCHNQELIDNLFY